jgi:fluoroquinolone transport system permease protein
MKRMVSLLFADFAGIRRDPMLMMSAAAPLILIGLLLFGFPALNTFLQLKLSFPINVYYPFACVFLLSLIPMLFGMVYGFILLDERDEGMITYFSVTPLGKRGYLLMRMLMPVIFSFVVMLLFIRITDFDNGLIWWKHVPLALVTATQAPILLLFLGAFAVNKVEGIAITKGFGILLMAVPVDYFISSKWTYIAGFSPLFWTARGFLAEEWLQAVIYAFVALIVHGLYVVVLYKKFKTLEK